VEVLIEVKNGIFSPIKHNEPGFPLQPDDFLFVRCFFDMNWSFQDNAILK